MMNKTIKTKWLKALRSRRYKYGAGEMFNVETERHCGIGVLLDMTGHYQHACSKSDLVDFVDSFTEFGLTKDDAINVARMNDDGILSGIVDPASAPTSYAEVIDYIEKEL
tara:strand:- start:253 stop:582 length:330 start_codon:yes stop_codon:yes gene_type:complete